MQAEPNSAALIIAGPTASGKSALALAIARRLGGRVINADAMQVYRELRILTARPTAEEEALAPHALYGVRAAAEPGNAAWWREEALTAMASARAGGLLPILCGGTGLYLSALTEGLAKIPEPGAVARQEARAFLASLGAAGLHSRLAAVDPRTATGLRRSDSQRLARAWEVWRGTGIGLAEWQARAGQGGAGWRFRAILLDPPRVELRAAIADRFAAMLAAGALEEVRALLALDLDPRLPLMRAHGVGELAACLRGEVTLAEAASRAIRATGQYVKRQATWFRHHAPLPPERSRTIIARFQSKEQFSENSWRHIIEFIDTPD